MFFIFEPNLSIRKEKKKFFSSFLKIKKSKQVAERALDGLKQLMYVKSRACLPFLVPYLTQPPVHIQSLCALCSCASIDILGRHLNKILATLVQALAASNETSAAHESATAAETQSWVSDCQLLLVSVHEAEGVRAIVTDLLQQVTNTEKSAIKVAALDMLNWFCAKTTADYSAHVDELIRSLLQLLVLDNEPILVRAWTCLHSCVDSLKGIALVQRLPVIRQTLRLLTQFHLGNQTLRFYAATMSQPDFKAIVALGGNYLLPGFCLAKKGIACLLPVFKEGLLNGPPDVKEASALTLCECIKMAE